MLRALVCHNLAASTELFRRMKRLLSIVILQAALLCCALPALAAKVCTREGMRSHSCCRHAAMRNHSCCHRAVHAMGDMHATADMHGEANQASVETSADGSRPTLASAAQRCPCLSRSEPTAPVLAVSLPPRAKHDAGQTQTYKRAFVSVDASNTLLVNARQHAPPDTPAPLFIVHRVFRL